MASEMALGIPEDLVAILSKLELKKLGEPVWKLQKRKTGYSVTIFWKNSEQARVELQLMLIAARTEEGDVAD